MRRNAYKHPRHRLEVARARAPARIKHRDAVSRPPFSPFLLEFPHLMWGHRPRHLHPSASQGGVREAALTAAIAPVVKSSGETIRTNPDVVLRIDGRIGRRNVGPSPEGIFHPRLRPADKAGGSLLTLSGNLRLHQHSCAGAIPRGLRKRSYRKPCSMANNQTLSLISQEVGWCDLRDHAGPIWCRECLSFRRELL